MISYCCYTSNLKLLKNVAVESQKVKQQELKNSESEDEDDSKFYLFSTFFEFAVYSTFIHLFNML
jgi:hypothetical protein